MRNAIIHRFRFRQFASEIGVQRSLESNRRRRRRSVLHERSMRCDSVKAHPPRYPFKISLVHSFPIPVYTLLSLEERNRSSIILLWFNKTVFAFRSRLKCKQISANDDRYDDGSLIKAVLDRIRRKERRWSVEEGDDEDDDDDDDEEISRRGQANRVTQIQ